MKHEPKVTANALAVLAAVLYVFCAVWSLVSKETFMSVMNTWTHTIDLSALPLRTPGMGEVILGLVTFTAAAWITGYAFAVVYNYFLSKK